MTIRAGLCQCGCGAETRMALETNKKRGWVKGQPIRFVLGHNAQRTGSSYIRSRVRIGDKIRHTREHILIAEKALGKRLPLGAQVHHVDGNPRNNNNNNLVICPDQAYHSLLHIRQRTLQAGGNPDTDRACTTCKAVKPIAAFVKLSTNKYLGRTSQCLDCSKAYWQSRKARKVAA